MTNFEYWKDEILRIINNDESLALRKEKPIACYQIKCENCEFFDASHCNRNRFNWLYSEHKELPKLTKRERAMCEVLEYGWIAADIDGAVYWYETVPHQFDTYYECEGECTGLSQIGLRFSFIKFYTGPWKVSDLLQLEVMEE